MQPGQGPGPRPAPVEVLEKNTRVTFAAFVNYGNTRREEAIDGFLTKEKAQAWVDGQKEAGDTAEYLIFKKVTDTTLISA